jgi:mono/diheme cytochrome c family protein
MRGIRIVSTLGGMAVAAAALLACAPAQQTPLEDYRIVDNTLVTATPDPLPVPPEEQAAIAQGRYMVTLMACGSCHTDGALIGRPNAARLLAGSTVGIAYSNPMATRFPGVVFPGNITPDDETGIGRWSVQDLVRMLQSGMDTHSQQSLPVMPWPSYVNLSDDDATAIALYLKSLSPVRHQVPGNVVPGEPTKQRYVHVGLYQKR